MQCPRTKFIMNMVNNISVTIILILSRHNISRSKQVYGFDKNQIIIFLFFLDNCITTYNNLNLLINTFYEALQILNSNSAWEPIEIFENNSKLWFIIPGIFIVITWLLINYNVI